MNQIEPLSDLKDLTVTSGSYSIQYSPVKVYPKTLTFQVEVTATIDEDPVMIKMEQTTDYYDFNKTKVTDLTE